MNPDRPRQSWFYRPMAIGLWLMLLLLMRSGVADFSYEASFFQMAAASVTSSLALMMLRQASDGRSGRSHGTDWFATIIACSIPICWAVMLRSGMSPIADMALFSLGICPLLVGLRPSSMSGPLRNHPTATQSISTKATPESYDAYSDETAEIIALPVPAVAPDLRNNSFELIAGDDAVDEVDVETSHPANVTQWMTRTVTDHGEMIEGGMRIEFAAGQRDATIHLSFCPPFSEVPEIVTEDLDAAGLEIRVAASFPFGARMTVRRPSDRIGLSGDFAGESYRVGFVAVVNPATRAA